jgi:hypothetical protein
LGCECTLIDEDLDYKYPLGYQQYRVGMLGKLSLPQQHLEEPLVNYRDNWYHLVDNFTELELAYHSDRLAAISGLAAKFHGASDEYISGLWRSDLVHGMLWLVQDSCFGRISYRQKDYQAPSWSWASVTGEIYSERFMKSQYEEVLEILNVEYTLATSNPFGSVSDASITVRGIALPVQLDAESWCIHLSLDNLLGENSHQDSRIRLPAINPGVEAGEEAQHANLSQESLFLCMLLSGITSLLSCGIVLRAVEGASEPRTFQRIGLWNPSWENYANAVILDIVCDSAEREVFKII